MSVRKPVKIGLIKKKKSSADEDEDTTFPPLSEAVMEALEDIVDG
jgi:hypothetical protein